MSMENAYDFFEYMKLHAPEAIGLWHAQTDSEVDLIVESIIEKAITSLEASKKDFIRTGENGLSSALIMRLNTQPMSARREANFNGHVDIVIEIQQFNRVRIKLCEAKIWDGAEYHLKGLDQLLGRYTTGRELRGLLITYVTKPNISRLVDKLREKMDAELPLNQEGKTKDHFIKWSFITKHKHSCGDDLEVGHIACNLH